MKMKLDSKVSLLIVVVVAVVAVSAFLLVSNNSPSPSSGGGSVVGNQAVLQEIARVSALTADNKTTVADLSTLGDMLKSDDGASDEFNELTVMVKYGEYYHATHALGFLGSYVQTGKETLCPGHELSHFYVFMRHNETDLANDALQTAKDTLAEWAPKAMAFNDEFPSGHSFGDIQANIQYHLDQIAAGNVTSSDSDTNFLSDESICVQAD